MTLSNNQTTTPVRSFQIAGFFLLLIGAFFDNLRGPLLPILSNELGIDYSVTSRFLTIGNFFSCILLLALIPILKIMPEGRAAKIAGWVLISACVASYTVSDLGTLYIFAALIGTGAAVFEALSNIFVVRGTPVKDQANVLSGLQVMYGLSSMIAPAAVALTIDFGFDWNTLFLASIPFVGLFLCYLSYKIPHHEPLEQVDSGSFALSRIQIFILLTFCLYVIAEVSCSMWMTPYLIEVENLSISEAPLYTSAFFFVMLASRLLCYFVLNERNKEVFLRFSLFAPLVFLTIGIYWKIPALLPLAGLFGPFWPIFISKVTKNFPEQWRSLTLWIIIGLQGSLLLMNFTMGEISIALGMETAYLMSPVFQLATIISFYMLRLKTKKF